MKRIGLVFCIFALLTVSTFADPMPSGSGGNWLSQNEAYVILNGLAFYREDGGSLKWKENLVIGDKVGLLNRTQKFKIEGKESEFTKIKSPSGLEGWARPAYLVSKSALAVIKADKAIVYSEPRDVKITSKYISNMTVVAVLQDGGTVAFSKLVCFDQAQNAYFTDPVFVAREDLTFSDTDVNAMILYITATATKNKDIRSNLFKVIEKRYSTSQFFDKIKAVLSPDAAAQVASSKPTAPMAASFIVNDNNVNVRAQPDEVNGQVLTQLNNGTAVEVIEATTQSYTVGGATAPWYRIKDPAGWVFGSFLKAVQ